MKSRGCFLAMACGLIAALAPARAQEYRGNVFAQITAENGAPVPEAKVTLAGSDFSRVQTADARGKVRFVKVEPGTYTLTAEAPNFAKVSFDNVEVNTLANVSLAVKMTPSTEMEEAIVVTAETPLLDQRKTGTSTVL